MNTATITTPKGKVRHLVNQDDPQAVTLCGKRHGVNPRLIRTGSDFLGPQESVTCRECVAMV